MRDSKDDFNCPLCGCRLLWFPVSHIFVCESCEQSFNEKAEAYLRHPTKSPVGNAAAMREALVLCSRIIGANGIHGNVFLDDIEEAHRAITAALSAPARNCDVMSLAVAKKVWFAKEIMPRLDGDLPLGKEIPFEEWFVAPAAERKGEGDEQK